MEYTREDLENAITFISGQIEGYVHDIQVAEKKLEAAGLLPEEKESLKNQIELTSECQGMHEKILGILKEHKGQMPLPFEY